MKSLIRTKVTDYLFKQVPTRKICTYYVYSQ